MNGSGTTDPGWPNSLETAGEEASRWLDYVCPACKGELERREGAYSCEPCQATYPVLVGIPDFRVFDDPYIDLEDDRSKAQRIAEEFDRTDFAGLIDFYWSITSHNHPHLVRRYVRHALTAVERGRETLALLEGSIPLRVSGPDRRCLEIGCGTGGFVVASHEQFGHVVGIDIAFRWLVVAKKRLQAAGASAQLVCCCAEELPFEDARFDLVVAGDVLEHTRTQRELIEEAHRSLRTNGVFLAATPNRFSLTPEPHVRVWGVGLLPRIFARRYVKWRTGIPYDHIRLVSRFELRRIVRRTAFRTCEIRLPTFGEGEQEGLSPRERRLIRLYHRLKDWPLVHQFLLVFGPVLQLVCQRRDLPGDTRSP